MRREGGGQGATSNYNDYDCTGHDNWNIDGGKSLALAAAAAQFGPLISDPKGNPDLANLEFALNGTTDGPNAGKPTWF